MIRIIVLAAALAFAAGPTLAAGKCGAPYKADANGACHDSCGKMSAKANCAAPAAAAKAAPNCKKGKPCGNTCIAKDKECHIK